MLFFTAFAYVILCGSRVVLPTVLILSLTPSLEISFPTRSWAVGTIKSLSVDMCLWPSTHSLNLQNSSPCNGLVKKSASICPVGQYTPKSLLRLVGPWWRNILRQCALISFHTTSFRSFRFSLYFGYLDSACSLQSSTLVPQWTSLPKSYLVGSHWLQLLRPQWSSSHLISVWYTLSGGLPIPRTCILWCGSSCCCACHTRHPPDRVAAQYEAFIHHTSQVL